MVPAINTALTSLGSMLQKAIIPLALTTAIPGSGCTMLSDDTALLDQKIQKATREIKMDSERRIDAFINDEVSVAREVGLIGNFVCPILLYEEIFVKHEVPAPEIRARAFCRGIVDEVRVRLQPSMTSGLITVVKVYAPVSNGGSAVFGDREAGDFFVFVSPPNE